MTVPETDAVAAPPASPGARRLRGVLRWWPVVLIVLAGVLIYASGVYRYVSLDTLEARQAELRAVVADHPIGTAALYVTAYTLFLMLSLPAGGVLTAAAGVMFGTFIGSVLAVAGAALAGTALYLALSFAVTDPLGRRHGPLIEKIRREMETDGISYLLVLRLLPVLPFWLVSLLPVLVGMRFAPYFFATVVGVIPPTVVFVSLGTGARQILAEHGHLHLASALSTDVLLPLVGLAVLSLLPIAWRHWRGAERS